MIAYKLFRVKKDGHITSLFINKSKNLIKGRWLKARRYVTKGFAAREGWHSLPQPFAPHLTNKGREWYKVEIKWFVKENRPKNQGGQWFSSRYMKILEKV